jgi:hypothetical protein
LKTDDLKRLTLSIYSIIRRSSMFKRSVYIFVVYLFIFVFHGQVYAVTPITDDTSFIVANGSYNSPVDDLDVLILREGFSALPINLDSYFYDPDPDLLAIEGNPFELGSTFGTQDYIQSIMVRIYDGGTGDITNPVQMSGEITFKGNVSILGIVTDVNTLANPVVTPYNIINSENLFHSPALNPTSYPSVPGILGSALWRWLESIGGIGDDFLGIIGPDRKSIYFWYLRTTQGADDFRIILDYGDGLADFPSDVSFDVKLWGDSRPGVQVGDTDYGEAIELLDIPLTASTDPIAVYQSKLPDDDYFAHTRGRDVDVIQGGDDDHTGIYFFEVDPVLADGTSAPDFYIYLFDGDNDADLNPSDSGIDDVNRENNTSGDTIFEYRLYGGSGAAINDDPLGGGDPSSYGGSIIDINFSTTGRNTLRTDLDGPSGSGLLMDQQNTIIGVDIDGNPGDLVNGRYIYKFVVDGSLGVMSGGDTATDWNRYQIDISTDSSDPNASDCPNPLVSSNCVSLFAYEMTFAGTPSPITTDTFLFVPTLTDHKLDIQTLDLDESQNPLWPVVPTSSSLTLPDDTVFDESLTFESGDQVLNGIAPYYWTSLNQAERIIPGEEFASAKDGATCGPGPLASNAALCYDTTGNENKVWSLKIDPVLSNNPFSLRAFGDVENPVPTSIRLVPVPGSIAVNNAPGLAFVGDQVVDAGTSTDVALSAPDLEGDAVSFDGSNLPSFASVIDNGDSTGILRIAPLGGDAGTYMDVVITACDDVTPQLCSSETISITVIAGDADGDGITDNVDLCPGTPAGEPVDANGCSASQLDSDGDGVTDNVDLCPGTPVGEPVDANGCSASQLDSDSDGVTDNIDLCPGTPAGEAVDANGCSASQRDTDGDGVTDNVDLCPFTPAEPANANGCSASQLDSDSDGVTDNIDLCPGTPAGEAVDADGCSASQLDSDSDGVTDNVDLCPGTPAGEAVDANGCSASQRDTDGDGVTDNIDLCPGTPAGEAVDADGCPLNNPPMASAGPNLTIPSEEISSTTIHGVATDPDAENTIQCRWKDGETVLRSWTSAGINGECPLDLNTLTMGIGTYTLVLEVTDGHALSSDSMILTIDNTAPHASSGGGVYEISTVVTLSGDVSDFDGDSLSYEWKEGGVVYCSGTMDTIAGGTPVMLPSCVVSGLDLGSYTFSLQVSDGINDSISSEITVEVVDTTVPTLEPVASEYILWPPNHKMEDIIIEANAVDNSGLPVTLDVVITSDEPDEGLGDGDEPNDIGQPSIDQTTGVIEFQLRRERSMSGDGRVYTVTITATDSSNNSSVTNLELIVPYANSY